MRGRLSDGYVISIIESEIRMKASVLKFDEQWQCD